MCIRDRYGEGIELLRQQLLKIAGWHPAEDVFIARERHLRALADTRKHIETALARLPELELFAEELRLAQAALASITVSYTHLDVYKRQGENIDQSEIRTIVS